MQDMTFSKALSIFGIKNNYTEDELKKRYHELVKLYHPDYHMNTTEEKKEEYNRKTQDINEAYDVLKKNLNKREYEIMCLRYGLKNGPMLTQREVAKKLQISRSYISRLEKKSLETLRKVIKRSEYL